MRQETKVYRAFYETKEKLLYFNQLKEQTKLSDSSLATTLRQLHKDKQIEKIEKKSNTFYRLIDKRLISLYFSMFDKERFENLSINIKVPLLEFVEKVPNNIFSVLLFGSSSRKQENKDSDIDLLIILHSFESKPLQELYEAEKKKEINHLKRSVDTKSLHRLSIVFINLKDFLASTDYLIVQAKETGFPIQNNQQFYERCLNES